MSFSIYAIVPNTPPIADSGFDETHALNSEVRLSALASNDADGDSLTFSWSLASVPDGSTAVLSDTTAIDPAFILDLPGSYTLQLIVNDSFEDSAVDTVTISTVNSPPVAEAGPGQTAVIGETVHLDVSGSSDVDGDKLSYTWAMRSAPAGSAASLSDVFALAPNFVVDQAGAYIVELSVSDGANASAADAVDISTLNTSPVANAGPDQKVALSDTVSLDGSGSGDVDGDPLTFSWSLVSKPAPSTASLSVATAIHPTFVVDEPGSYVLQLIVNDGTASSLPDTVEVSTSATRPVAKAGIDQSITAGDVVNLSGMGSFDADADVLSYRWSLLNVPGGSSAALDFPNAVNPGFTADLSGSYIAQLIVNDGSLSSKPDTVVISSENVRPIANAGLDQTVNADELVQLIGTASHDANSDLLNYHWSFSQKPTGSNAVLSDVSLSNPTFTPDVAGFYLLQLIVDDGILESPPDTVGISVKAPQPLITDFSPKSASSGALITVTGSNLKGVLGASKVTLSKQGGGTIAAPVGSAIPTRLTFTVPPGASSGTISVDVVGQSASSASPLTIIPSNDFSLNVAPASAELIQGESLAYTVKLNSANGFTQLSKLSLTGLPAGITASFKPAQITAGQTSILTLSAPAAQPTGVSTLTVTASATVDGIPLSQSGTVSVTVVPITTSFRGQAVIADPLQTPLGGVTVTLLGLDGAGNPTGCTGTTKSDAAGNFTFTNLPSECLGKQLIRYDGTTATATGEYAGVDLIYNIQDGVVTESPVLIHLPRIDNAETVMVQQNAATDQHFTFSTIPNLKATVYAGTTLTLKDGTQPNPFPLVAIEVPIDRLPDEMPPGMTTVDPFIVAFQPANATASQPVAVTFPNPLNTPVGTVVSLMTLDPTQGVMVQYGTGTVSSDGTKIVPDPDPAFPGRQFGLVHFDWHGPAPQAPPIQPNCDCFSASLPGASPIQAPPIKGKPVDLSSGLELMSEVDIGFSNSRGSIAIRRAYRSLSTEAGPFGLGTSHNYGYRLDSQTPNTVGNVSLIMPDGNRIAMSRQDDISDLGTLQSGGRRATLRANRTVPNLQGAVLQTFSDGTSNLHWKEGTIFHFEPSIIILGSVLTGITDPNGNKTTLIRDPERPMRITEIIDPVDRKLILNYNLNDRITSITDPIGRTVRYTYNPAGMLKTVTNPEGDTTRYEYDAQNRLLRVIDARGITMAENTYDTNGRIVQQVQADGGVLKFSYQLLNPAVPNSPVIKTIFTDALGNQTIYRFNPQGFVIGITDALGQTRSLERASGTNQVLARRGNGICPICGATGAGDREFTYDSRGNLLSIRDLLGNTTQLSYEPKFNRVTSATDALGFKTQFTYDAVGNPLSSTDANGNTVGLEYDLSGLLQAITDPPGNKTRILYDHFANPTALTDPLGEVTTAQFDAVSRLVAEANALGQRTGRVYDKLDRVTSVTDAEGRITRFAYDAVGNLLSVTDARGNITSFTYDKMNRLLTKTDSLGNSDSRAYDLNGNLTQFTDRKGQISRFMYDSLNRPIRADYHDGNSVTQDYDARGRLVRVNDSEGGIFTFDYDVVGRVTRETGPFGAVEYTYDKTGRVLTRQVVGQPAQTHTYDAVGNLLSTAMPQGRIDFTYDARNQLTRQTRANGIISDYLYDEIGRLTSIRHGNGTTVLNHQIYTYDALGRRISSTTEFAQSLNTPSAPAIVDPLSNQLQNHGEMAYTHDLNGNRLSETGPGGTTIYEWDARNRLKSLTDGSGKTIRFRYDFGDNMIEQTTDTDTGTVSQQFILDGLTNVAFQSDSEGNRFSVLTGQGIDAHLAVVRESGGTDYALPDGLNSTVATTDETGTVVGNTAYEPFGAETQTGEAFPFQFTGRSQVSENLYYYRARFYDPHTGRFVSEDPIGFAGGDVNLYRYVGNNPVNFVDPTGLTGPALFRFVFQELLTSAVCETLGIPTPMELIFWVPSVGDGELPDINNNGIPDIDEGVYTPPPLSVQEQEKVLGLEPGQSYFPPAVDPDFVGPTQR